MDEEILDSILQDGHYCLAGINQNDPHLLQLGLEKLANHTATISSILLQTDVETELGASYQNVLEKLVSLRACVENSIAANSVEEAVHLSTPISLDPSLVTELRRQGLPWSKIGAMHGITRQSMYKYRIKHDIQEPHEKIGNEELYKLVAETANHYPNAGIGFMLGVIKSAGFRVSRKRVWKCLKEVDPVGIVNRRKKCIARRTYKVKGSNYLWHIDSNHKLIMFRFVIHGCVDGYSRRLIYLNVANNNKGKTVLTMFKDGVLECGLPRRVRGDRGSENFAVKYFIDQNSTLPNAFIFGRSVHNTRIERLWRDVNTQILFIFKTLFKNLEEQGKLDENNELHLFLLSYVFFPRIQRALDVFQKQWNSHCIRTMGNRTPMQEWTVSIVRQGLENFYPSVEDLDVDSDDDISEENGVIVPTFPAEFSCSLLEECQAVVPDPLSEDGSHGMNHYISLVNHVYSQLNLEVEAV